MRKDPSLQDGWVEIHQQELPMIVKSESLSFEDAVMVRVFQSGQGYKLQLTSEMNISFFYSLVLTAKELAQRVEQTVQDEPNWFRDIFSGAHRCQLTVHSVENAQLVVTQEEKFKNYELANFELEMGDERRMRESLMYRYQRMKLRERMLEGYWENMCAVVRTKNPSLLLQLDSKFKRSAFK